MGRCGFPFRRNRNFNAAPSQPSKTVEPLRGTLHDYTIFRKKLVNDIWTDWRKEWLVVKYIFMEFPKFIAAECAMVHKKAKPPSN